MPNLIAIPDSLRLLRQGLIEGASAEDLALPLRALQQRGLSQPDLVVKIERIRTENQLTGADEEVEEHCLVALDLVHGVGGDQALQWDVATTAALLLPRALAPEDLASAVGHALQPSDLLPPREGDIRPALRAALADAAASAMDDRELRPTLSTMVRVPKRAFTSRPASVMSFADRIAFEALASSVEDQLDSSLPRQVIWPRSRALESIQVVTETVKVWNERYVAKADIANFYEAIEHSLLAVLLSTRLRLSTLTARAVEALLTATMGLPRGLPQGPAGSELFASAYLLPVDEHLVAAEIEFVRYADDYYFPASSVGEGRARLSLLESLINDLGLSLSPEKSAVMSYGKFIEGAERPEVQQFKRKTVESHFAALGEAERQAEQVRLGAAVGLSEQTVWDLVYHGTIEADELMEDLLQDDAGPIESVYRLCLIAVAGALRGDVRDDSLATLNRVARESLTVLRHSEIAVTTDRAALAITPRDLDSVELWFPDLAPLIAQYLVSRDADIEVVGRYVSRRLRDLKRGDWVDSWAAYTAGLLPKGVVSTRRLQKVLRAAEAGPLTKAEAARALLRHDQLSERVWRQICAELPPPIRAEVIFSAIVEPGKPEWLRRFAGDDLPAALNAVRSRLPEGI